MFWLTTLCNKWGKKYLTAIHEELITFECQEMFIQCMQMAVSYLCTTLMHIRRFTQRSGSHQNFHDSTIDLASFLDLSAHPQTLHMQLSFYPPKRSTWLSNDDLTWTWFCQTWSWFRSFAYILIIGCSSLLSDPRSNEGGAQSRFQV